jgi:CheY-like chemotaxis protein
MLPLMIGEHVELEVRLADNLNNIKVDPMQMEQVIINLAVNSRDAMPEGGVLTIETENVYLDQEYCRHHAAVEPGWYVRLAVSDSGNGMDETTKSRVFEPFFTTKAVGKGTGLGLSTVHGIVKQSGGHIWIYSEVGKGTAFKLFFPVADHNEAKPAEPPLDIISPGGSETVLLVEDNDDVRALAAEVLSINGYSVLQTGDPAQAPRISEAHKGAIDLLITDVVMPRLSGRRLAEELAIRRPKMRVLYMSGYTDNAIVHQTILDPDVAFLQKPFTPNSLLRKVRQVLD